MQVHGRNGLSQGAWVDEVVADRYVVVSHPAGDVSGGLPTQTEMKRVSTEAFSDRPFQVVLKRRWKDANHDPACHSDHNCSGTRTSWIMLR